MNSVAEFFNTKASTWDERNVHSTSEKINYILRKAGVKKSDSVLDIGTGTGVLLPHIAKKAGLFGRISAVDISPGMLALAHEKYAHLKCQIEFLLADVEEDAIHGLYDCIILYCMYPHLRHPMATLRKLADQNLAPGGTITIAHPTGRDFVNAVHHRVSVFSNGLPPAHTLSDELAENGFDTACIEETDEIYILSFKSGETSK